MREEDIRILFIEKAINQLSHSMAMAQANAERREFSLIESRPDTPEKAFRRNIYKKLQEIHELIDGWEFEDETY